jgi:hypothetical protein
MPKTTSHYRVLGLLLLASLALAALACAKPQPLANPKPIAAASTPAQTRVAILRALADRDFILESEKTGDIVARYSERNWDMVIAISYSNEISIRYISSSNLDYGTTEQGVTVIHRGYNRRVEELAKEISTEVTIARLTDSPPPAAATPPVAAPPPARELQPE